MAIEKDGNTTLHTNLEINDDGDIKVKTTIIDNNIPTMTSAQYMRTFGKNGFNKTRSNQWVGGLPESIYYSAVEAGYDMNNEHDVLEVFKKYKEFLNCDPWVKQGSNSHRIIIK